MKYFVYSILDLDFPIVLCETFFSFKLKLINFIPVNNLYHVII